MSIASKLPTMTDAELATLHENTKRVIGSGTPPRQAAAVALMPSIAAELSARSEVAAAKRAEAMVLRRASKVKPSPAVSG